MMYFINIISTSKARRIVAVKISDSDFQMGCESGRPGKIAMAETAGELPAHATRSVA
jgi:hypothetical protein